MNIKLTVLSIIAIISIVFCIIVPESIFFFSSLFMVLFIFFRFTSIPYKLIAYIFYKVSKANSCSIILPFKVNKVPDESAFITVPNISITKWRKAHELHHVSQVRQYINKYGEIGRYIFCFTVLKYLLQYGYDNSPIEIEANEAANKQCR